MTYLASLILCCSILYAQNIAESHQTSFTIEEANITFDLPKEWEFVSKTGKLAYGKVQYSYSHGHVQGNGRLINPSITITVDKASWYSDEKNYLEDKLGFHQSMGDVIEVTYAFGHENNPLKIKAYYTECVSSEDDHPYGQRLMLVTFWNTRAGFNMEIQTSEKDLKNSKNEYNAILKSIKLIEPSGR